MYRYFNRNPDKERINDCVIRAISLALTIPYYDVVEMLYYNSRKCGCDPLAVGCYGRMLDRMGLPHFVGYGWTMGELAKFYEDNIVLLRTEGHLSVSMYGEIDDIFNPSDTIVTDYWIV